MKDCNMSVKLKPDYATAYSRLVAALVSLKKYRQAADNGYAHAMRLEPVSSEYRANYEKAKVEADAADLCGSAAAPDLSLLFGGGGGGGGGGGMPDLASMLGGAPAAAPSFNPAQLAALANPENLCSLCSILKCRPFARRMPRPLCCLTSCRARVSALPCRTLAAMLSTACSSAHPPVPAAVLCFDPGCPGFQAYHAGPCRVARAAPGVI